MKVVFAGTPSIAASCLQSIIDSSHQLLAVFTQPDRPAGRGRQITASAVKQLAQQHQLSIHQPLRFDQQAQSVLQQYDADIMVVVAYGLILPAAALSIPRHGCVNVHVSLLPRWRGAAPIQRAIEAGDHATGVTTMQMDAGLDTGNILLQRRCMIADDDTSASLHDKLAVLGAETLIETLDNYHQINQQAQQDQQACYANKIDKSEAAIDWQKSAADIDRQIRAFNPWPVATMQMEKEVIRVWLSEVVSLSEHSYSPGEIVSATSHGVDVATAEGIVRLLQLQFSGAKAMAVADILNSPKRAQLLCLGKKFNVC